MTRGHLWLVGAGPGDPELLTLKAARALQGADVVLHDSLVHPDILRHAHPRATVRCVGKRAGRESTPQVVIHELIAEAAHDGKQVVRLKGGDPMMLGRAGEEMAFAEAAGIPWTYVPGISSGTSLPGLSGIPPTLRGVASAAWLGTATDQHGRLTSDLVQALSTNATLIIFMGRRRIRDIARHLVHGGRGSMPVAVISEGSLPGQQTVVHDADTWLSLKTLPTLPDPALLVVGEVVHHRIQHQSNQALIPESHPQTHSPIRHLPTFQHEHEIPPLPQTGSRQIQRLRRV
jgi:uroporphyrin-III C-methyltransferase